jgi:cytochrome c-type biogenesis protein CcmE
MRIQGTVERGTVVEAGTDTEFDISFNEAVVPVRYDGEPGGIFKECIPVVVHGVFDEAACSSATASR